MQPITCNLQPDTGNPPDTSPDTALVTGRETIPPMATETEAETDAAARRERLQGSVQVALGEVTGTAPQPDALEQVPEVKINRKRSHAGLFKPGDPRSCRTGRPGSFEALRKLILKVLNEEHPSAKQQGKNWKRIEVMMRQWASSPNPTLQKTIVEMAYGKAPERVEVTGYGGGPIQAETKRVYNLDKITTDEAETLGRILDKLLAEEPPREKIPGIEEAIQAGHMIDVTPATGGQEATP